MSEKTVHNDKYYVFFSALTVLVVVGLIGQGFYSLKHKKENVALIHY